MCSLRDERNAPLLLLLFFFLLHMRCVGVRAFSLFSLTGGSVCFLTSEKEAQHTRTREAEGRDLRMYMRGSRWPYSCCCSSPKKQKIFSPPLCFVIYIPLLHFLSAPSQSLREQKMAFTKAFYEQAFERNLKAQQQQKPETTSGFAAASSAMTRTQRATMQFTAYSKKEVVRVVLLFLFSFLFLFFF